MELWYASIKPMRVSVSILPSLWAINSLAIWYAREILPEVRCQVREVFTGTLPRRDDGQFLSVLR